MDIINSIISQTKKPFQYVLIGACWFIFELYQFPINFLIPSIMISSGIAYGLSKLSSYVLTNTISWFKHRSSQKRKNKKIEKEIIELLYYLTSDSKQLDRLNNLMSMENLGYSNHKKIDNSKPESVDCVFFIRELNMNTYQQNGTQWFREDYDQVMKYQYIWIDPHLMGLYNKIVKK